MFSNEKLMPVVSSSLSIVSVSSFKPSQSSLSPVPGGCSIAVVGRKASFVPVCDGCVNAGEPEVGGRCALARSSVQLSRRRRG